jgi:hypothetical protein
MTSQERFEAKFPVPEGIYFSDNQDGYVPVDLNDAISLRVSAGINNVYKGWKAATQDKQAEVAAAIQMCAKRADSLRGSGFEHAIVESLLALTPADARKALGERDMRIAKAVAGADLDCEDVDALLRAIVERVKNDK